MDAKKILDELMQRSGQLTPDDPGTLAARRTASQESASTVGDERTAMLKGAGAGALGAGAVALLFGSKGTRKFAKKAAKLGGTAALGGLAYKAYTEWQTQQEVPSPVAASGRPDVGEPRSSAAPPLSLKLDQFPIGTPVDALAPAAAADRSEALIRAMISAARADGHVDATEMAMITERMEGLELERDVARFLIEEMGTPVDVTRIAALADTRETAAELYLASAMVADGDDPDGRAYLDSLADALALDATVVRELEAPLRA